jgi:hypothetical protein
MFVERLIGFDIRDPIGGSDHLWDANRREVFLLRRDVLAPLSVDTSVWPSVFDSGQGIGLPEVERVRLGLAGIPLPTYTGPNASLWEDAETMRRYLIEKWENPKPCVTIAISWISDSGFSEGDKYGPYLSQTSPSALDPRWERLGFDIGDGSLVSGLSNCGYLAEEAQDLRDRWGASLTDHHLFDDLPPAFQFRDLVNQRVTSHAPFFVYGLYLIDSFAREISVKSPRWNL